jgi:hypothetical protein
MFVAVADNWRFSSRPPSSTTGWDKHEAALIDEYQMGAKFFGFFLYEAICNVSNVQSLHHPVEWPVVLEPDMTSDCAAKRATHGSDDTAHQIHSESHVRSVSMSTIHLKIRRPMLPSVEFSTVADNRLPEAWMVYLVPVSIPKQKVLPFSSRAASGRLT